MGLRADVLLRGHGAGGLRVRGDYSPDPEAGRLLDQFGTAAVSLAGGRESRDGA